jgi:ABC-2 type transport system ATP-binding protein
MSIKIEGLSKYYGDQQALKGVSFSIKQGEIVGFLGPNGAGKSTLMKIVTGYLKSSEGRVVVCGTDVATNPIAVQKQLGYLPEHNPLYMDMYIKEYLKFNAGLQGVSEKEIPIIIEKVGLRDEAHKKIHQLSKGYKQRVGLAAALLHDPEVLILDEPTTGLDPNQLVEIRELIKEVGANKTVLFSTHIMQEVEALCNRVLLINKGELIADKSLEELQGFGEQIIEVEFDLRVEKEFIKRIPNLKRAENTHDTNWVLTFDTLSDMRPVVFDFAKDHGLKTLNLSTKNKNLESLFIELTASST